MSTNDEPETPVSEDAVAELATALAEAKDTKPEAQASEPEAQSDPTPEAEDKAKAEPDATLTIDVPAESEKDLEWYKKAYENSTTEALRLKGELDKATPVSEPPVIQAPADPANLDPDKLYLEHLRTKDIATVWTKLVGEYPQLADPQGDTYKRFVQRSTIMGKTILEDEKRYVEPSELYPMVISSLGLNKGDDQEKLAAALKDGAASPRTSSGSPSQGTQSKVTDAMMAMNRKMYPNKTDAEIREELEPYVQ